MGLDGLIPLLVHLVLERWQLPPWWQTHKRCQADCKQKSHRSRHNTKDCPSNNSRIKVLICGGGKNARLLPDCDWSVAAPVGVIDYCIERLIDPLPEQDGWSRPARLKMKCGDKNMNWWD